MHAIYNCRITLLRFFSTVSDVSRQYFTIMHFHMYLRPWKKVMYAVSQWTKEIEFVCHATNAFKWATFKISATRLNLIKWICMPSPVEIHRIINNRLVISHITYRICSTFNTMKKCITFDDQQSNEFIYYLFIALSQINGIWQMN